MGVGSGHGVKRPDHYVAGGGLKARPGPNEKKNLKSLFSNKLDPSCHRDKCKRDSIRLNVRYSEWKDNYQVVKEKKSPMSLERKRKIALEARDLQDLARSMANTAVQALADIIEDPETPAAARLQAIDMILSRGYGKPAVTMNVNQNVDSKPAELDDTALTQRIAENLKRLEDSRGRASEETESSQRPTDLRKYN